MQSFRKNVKINLKTDEKVRDEKLKNNINREAAKILALTLEKVDKYEYLTDTKIPSDQSRMMGQTKIAYSSLRKALEKQTKRIEDQGKNK